MLAVTPDNDGGGSLNLETGSVCWILRPDVPFITGGGLVLD